MTEPITFRFTPTPKDYVRMMRVIYVRQTGNWIFMAVLAFFSGFILWLTMTGLRLHLYTILMAPLALVFFVVLIFLVYPWRVGNRAKKNDRMTAETIWEASENQILIKSAQTEAKTDWGNFKKAIENDEFIFLKSSTANLYQFIPKRAFESPAQLEAFRALVKSKLPGLQ